MNGSVMKPVKYIVAGLLAVFSLWLFFHTWRASEEAGNGAVQIRTPADDAAANKPTDKHLEAWRSQAQFLMLSAATNDIIGFRRLIDSKVEDYERAVSNWTGTVTAEYINSVGGVSRTNCLYIFQVYGGTLHPRQDIYNMTLNAARAGK